MRFPKIAVALVGLALVMMLAAQASAQESSPPAPGPDQGPPPAMMPPPEGGPPAMGLHGQGGWWKNPQLRQKLQLSDDQIQKIEKIARDQQIQAINLRADVEKQDAVLRNLMESDSIDKAQVFAQIDKLSEARALLEKSHVETLLAIRKVLTAEQAKKLRDLSPMGGPRRRRFGPPEGPQGPPPGGPTQ